MNTLEARFLELEALQNQRISLQLELNQTSISKQTIRWNKQVLAALKKKEPGLLSRWREEDSLDKDGNLLAIIRKSFDRPSILDPKALPIDASEKLKQQQKALRAFNGNLSAQIARNYDPNGSPSERNKADPKLKEQIEIFEKEFELSPSFNGVGFDQGLENFLKQICFVEEEVCKSVKNEVKEYIPSSVPPLSAEEKDIFRENDNSNLMQKIRAEEDLLDDIIKKHEEGVTFNMRSFSSMPKETKEAINRAQNDIDHLWNVFQLREGERLITEDADFKASISFPF